MCKVCYKQESRLRYKLRNANVFVCPDCGLHYIDYLDNIEEIIPTTKNILTDEAIKYINNGLQYNQDRFLNHIKIINQLFPSLRGLKILDIGCGGGLFINLMKKEGADVTGIELSDVRVAYAKETYGIQVYSYPVEHEFWQSNYHEAFDAITLWDVIEHVNFPIETLRKAVALLKKGGMLFMDTPCRDGFYHKIGCFTYKVSMGKYPTFLNSMYSNHPFGHKQILTLDEMATIFKMISLKTIILEKFHELSFPYRFYLEKFITSNLLNSILLPMVTMFFRLFRIKNKILAVGRKED